MMLAAKNLERLIEIEADLKAQYQAELNSKDTEIARGVEKQDALKKTIQEQKETIEKQLAKLKSLSEVTADTGRLEQVNRELTARSNKLQEELGSQKKRIKSLQKDLATEREELKALKKLDPRSLKKNLDANKKKIAEKTAANEALQKTANKHKKENDLLKNKIKELEAQLAAAESQQADHADVQEEAVA